jgi:hypothetical protein
MKAAAKVAMSAGDLAMSNASDVPLGGNPGLLPEVPQAGFEQKDAAGPGVYLALYLLTQPASHPTRVGLSADSNRDKQHD